MAFQEYKGYVYVLALVKNKYYVGYTERKDYIRIDEQFYGVGAMWVKMYPPTSLLAFFPGNKEDENIITIELMKLLHWQNVRGGKYCNPYMWRIPIELEPKEADKILNILGVLYNNKLGNIGLGEMEIVKSSVPAYLGRCTRCMRWGHTDTYCLSRAFSRGRCYRCNHEGCQTETCKQEVYMDD